MDMTFIVVSHDMDFVKDICDRLALMRGGRIVQIGSTGVVLSGLTEDERAIMSRPAPPG
jgi:methyl coenzyme M reductase system subunit A2